MATSEQLARQAAATRERLSRTIDELRLRTSPAQLVDDVAGYLRLTGGRSRPNTTATPSRSRYVFPLAVIGAGLTWLALEARRSERAAEPTILPVAETEVIATPATPTVAPDQGATLRPVDAGSIAPEQAPPVPTETIREKVEPHKRPQL